MDKEAFNKKVAEILKDIPEVFRDSIFNLAWSYGHSEGYSEVLIYLKDIVNAVKEPIEKVIK
jgi:hypothetical protein